MAFQTPRPGKPIARGGKPYVWVTHLAKLLGGQQCLWSAYFKAHFRYEKFETQGPELAEWNRDHTLMMRARKQELEENGWSVAMEDQNKFALEGQGAIVAGKPDIVATMPGHILIVDGKTGRERDADWWQVLIYLFAWPLAFAGLKAALEGEIHYRVGDKRLPVKLRELTDERRDVIVRLIRDVSADAAPPRAPSREECARCNIGPLDCPERFKETTPATTAVAAGF